ncbi:hypothetical protein MBLNU230_g1814t1 [Neophaeotheca triangularis]
MSQNLLPSTVQGTASSKIQGPYASTARRQKPIVTYGKQAKPLSLTGSQFLLSSIFDIPEDEAPAAKSLDDAIGPSFQTPLHHNSESDSSLLSGAEDSGHESSQHESETTTKTDIPRPGKLKAVPKGTVSRGLKKERIPCMVTKTRRQKSGPEGRVAKSNPSRQQKVAKASRKRALALSRHLPVNELLLVTGTSDDQPPGEVESEVESEVLDYLSEDPIEGFSSSARRDSEEACSDKQNVLSFEFRKRIQKPFVAQKFKQIARKKISRAPSNAMRAIGDGFEVSEAAVKGRRKGKRKRHSGYVEPVTYALSTLELGKGPLPSVEFGDPTGTSDVKLDHLDDDNIIVDSNPGAMINIGHRPIQHSYHSTGQVYFPTSLELDDIASKLSSISAPPRPLPDADEEAAEDELEELMSTEGDEIVDTTEEQDEDEDEDLRSFPTPSVRSEAATALSRQSTIISERSGSSPQLPSTIPESIGVYCDVRKPRIPWISQRSCRKRKPTDIEDSVIEIEDSSCYPRAPSRFSSLQSQITGEDMLDDGPPASPPRIVSSARPRSILKSSFHPISRATTRPEDTGSNTRRNTLTQAASSRYFTTAQDELTSPDGESTPRPGTNKKVRRQSTFLDLEYELHTLPDDSGVDGSANFTGSGQLYSLSKTEDVVYTSSCRGFAEAGDLKSLTRRVSKEFGTLSQSVRRGSGSGFRSPWKAV